MPPDDPTAPPPLDASQLRRRTLPDGTEVFTGPLAEQALDAVGARAMTLDRSILVREDLDPSNPEDQALLAHEQHHAAESGGEGAHAEGDEEEAAARAVEAFVLHQRRAQSTDERATGGDAPMAAAPPGARGSDAPMAGYQALLAGGTPHDQIVDRLARGVLDELRRTRDLRQLRGKRWP